MAHWHMLALLLKIEEQKGPVKTLGVLLLSPQSQTLRQRLERVRHALRALMMMLYKIIIRTTHYAYSAPYISRSAKRRRFINIHRDIFGILFICVKFYHLIG